MTVPSIVEGRTDRWRLMARGPVSITAGAAQNPTAIPTTAVMPDDLAAALYERAANALGVALLDVEWVYPRPRVSTARGIPLPVYLVDDLCRWYAGELHRAAQR
jgi:hypothetical protein